MAVALQSVNFVNQLVVGLAPAAVGIELQVGAQVPLILLSWVSVQEGYNVSGQAQGQITSKCIHEGHHVSHEGPLLSTPSPRAKCFHTTADVTSHPIGNLTRICAWGYERPVLPFLNVFDNPNAILDVCACACVYVRVCAWIRA
jgi:hypothetical protein